MGRVVKDRAGGQGSGSIDATRELECRIGRADIIQNQTKEERGTLRRRRGKRRLLESISAAKRRTIQNRRVSQRDPSGKQPVARDEKARHSVF